MEKIIKIVYLFPVYLLMRIVKVPMFWKNSPMFKKYNPQAIDFVLFISFLLYFLVGWHTLWIGFLIYAIVIYGSVYLTKDQM